MLIKNIRDISSVPLIGVDKDTYFMLINNGFYLINIEDGRFMFQKTDDLCKFLRKEGVSME